MLLSIVELFSVKYFFSFCMKSLSVTVQLSMLFMLLFVFLVVFKIKHGFLFSLWTVLMVCIQTISIHFLCLLTILLSVMFQVYGAIGDHYSWRSSAIRIYIHWDVSPHHFPFSFLAVEPCLHKGIGLQPTRVQCTCIWLKLSKHTLLCVWYVASQTIDNCWRNLEQKLTKFYGILVY